jgi:hypothetical protein
MGLLPFKKKKKAAAVSIPKNSSNLPSTDIPQAAPITSTVTPATEVGTKQKWSPIRKILSSKTPVTNDSSLGTGLTSGIFNTVNVAGKDNVEVMTLESQRNLMDQREAIRKKLFESSSNNEDDTDFYDDQQYGSKSAIKQSSTLRRTATDASQEVLRGGMIRDTDVVSAYDRFSLPIQLPGGGGGDRANSWDGSLQKISEAPVYYSKVRSNGPVSVDFSYTESELASVISNRIVTPQSTIEPTTFANISETEVGDDSETAVVSPANTTHTSIPMDEQMDDLELQRALNAGKSPLKGMPEDERLEYQKDEMESLPASPLRNIGLGFASVSPFRFMQGNIQTQERAAVEVTPPMEQQSHPAEVTQETCTTSSEKIPTSNTNQSSLSRVPELGRSILRAAYDCGNGALNNTLTQETKAVGDVTAAVVPDVSGVRIGEDETASLTTLTMSNKRPVYLDEASTLRFLRRITKNGFVLLYLQAPDDGTSEANATDDWKGRTVTMMIHKGASSGSPENTLDKSNRRLPLLEWTTVTGGQTLEATTTSISLLNILSIATNDDDVDDEDDMCFFTITGEDGEVHIFETATVEERDRIVNGLKTLIARWSFHMIAGDVTATSELFESHGVREDLNQSGDELPSLPNPNHTMNSVAHMLLNSEI